LITFAIEGLGRNEYLFLPYYLDIIEKDMLAYFNADKINIASFGNRQPQVHWHIMARFEQDSYFPEPMWGDKQRDATLNLPSFEDFYQQIKSKL
jgi:diadenosine tetraphosphate (Ap4A) HIT family hydrolase